MSSAEKLVGYKYSTFFDPGYFYCPYIPVIKTSVVLSKEFFTEKDFVRKPTYRSLDDQWENHLDID